MTACYDGRETTQRGATMLPASLPSYSSETLADLGVGELVDLVIRHEDRVPRNVIDELARRGDATVAELEARFAPPEAWLPDVPLGRWWLRLHAAMVLGLIPTADAAEALARWIRRIDETGDEDTQEWLAGYWPALFANKPTGMIDALRELSEDRGLGWFARAEAIEALAATAARLGRTTLDAELERVARLAADEQEDWDVRMSAGNLLLDFPRPAHRALLDALAQRQPRLGAAFKEDDVEQAYAKGRDEPDWNRFADPWAFYEPGQIEARRRRWAEERERAAERLESTRIEQAFETTYVRETPKVGRNDPCPCGSGKKYKRCCLAAQSDSRASPENQTWARIRRVLDGQPRRMTRFVDEVYGDAALEEGWTDFLLWQGPDFDPESLLLPLFMPWMFHCWKPDPFDETSITDESLHGRPPTRVFLERRGRQLDPLLHRYLEACLEAPFSFHEIRRRDPGRGFMARDVITGEEHDVRERSASETLEVGDILFAQLVPIDGIVLLEACSPCAIPPDDKIPIIELRQKILSAPHAPSRPRDLLDSWRIELRELYLELVDRYLNPRPPVLHNTDGELILPQTLSFEIDSAEAVFETLQPLALREPGEDLLADAERSTDGRLERVQLPWCKADTEAQASSGGTILGHLEITRSRLVAHVNSNERAQAFREIVTEKLGEAATYLGLEVPSFDDETASSAEAEAETDAEHERLMQDPQVRAHLNELIAAHYDDWMTQQIPALGNRRPIDVVKDPDGREKVEALLARFERDAQRTSGGPDETVLRRLRERLGLV